MIEAYLGAAGAAAGLLGSPEVAAFWDRPSALAEFRVSGLAGHLASQVLGVPKVLGTEVPPEPPIPLLDHYTRAAWVDAPLDAEANAGIRTTGETIAADGPAALAGTVEAAVAEVAALLREQPTGRLAYLPWNGWALTLDDYLTTRMMEIAVHSDDLAVSVGIDAPALPPEVTRPVFALLTSLAEHRNGTSALLRALTRAERAPARINAF